MDFIIICVFAYALILLFSALGGVSAATLMLVPTGIGFLGGWLAMRGEDRSDKAAFAALMGGAGLVLGWLAAAIFGKL